MHQLLWQASTEAAGRASAMRDLDSVALASNLTYACDQVFHLVPATYRDALLERPDIGGGDPVELARRAEELSRTMPVQQSPPGIDSVVALLRDTVRDFS
jgi:hypothetical protein